MIRRLLASIHPRNQPWITRQSYSHELITVMTFPVAIALIEGSVVGVLAKKAFQVGPMQFAAIMAAPMFANLTSVIWAHLGRCRRKVPFIVVLQTMTLALVASIALLPLTAAGAMMLTGLVVLSRCFVSGIVTLRSTIWRMNYPRRVRARVTGRLALIQSIVFVVVPLVGYGMLDRNPEAFRLIYPASLLIAMVGVLAFSRVRLRRERELLRYEADPSAHPQARGGPGAVYEYDPQETGDTFWTILRRDHQFRRYQQWQFCSGMANMMGDVIIIYLIAELTEKHNHAYLISIALTTAIPMLVCTLTLPAWAGYLDRVHVTRLRCRQGLFWVATQLLNWIGAFFGSLLIIAVARAAVGMIRGGGMLAWNLGHNDFADRRLVSLYMGIHVTLTGVRGALGPFLAMALYAGWSKDVLGWAGFAVMGFDGIGHHFFLITGALAALSFAGFYHLDRSIGRGRAVVSSDG